MLPIGALAAVWVFSACFFSQRWRRLTLAERWIPTPHVLRPLVSGMQLYHFRCRCLVHLYRDNGIHCPAVTMTSLKSFTFITMRAAFPFSTRPPRSRQRSAPERHRLRLATELRP